MHRPIRHIGIRGLYDAAGRSPEAMRHYAGADGLSADASLDSATRHIIIRRARYEVANNPWANGINVSLAEETIGTGPRLQLYLSNDPVEIDVDGIQDALQRRELRFREWSMHVDLAEKLKIARQAKSTDGEVFFRFVRNPKLDGYVKIDLTLYEAEQVGSRVTGSYAEFWESGVPKEFDGISFDRYGNAVGYRLWRIHPGSAGLAYATDDSVIVPSNEMVQYAHITRPGQHRGVSELAPALNALNDLRRYTTAVISSAESAASIGLLLHTSSNPEVDEYGEGVSESPLQFMDTIDLPRNTGMALPEGWDATQLKAEQPTDKYVEFLDAKLTEVARALGIPFCVAKGDSSKSNYASGRMDYQIYHRRIKSERSRIGKMVLDKCLRMFESFDEVINPQDYAYDGEVSHYWMWDGFEHVDPQKEANAQKIRLETGVTTREEECARDGKDFGVVLRQRAREQRLAEKLGISLSGDGNSKISEVSEIE